ncbi:hypothetical protein GTR00_11700 [Kineococcus sp. T90]|nr:hypothetical protein [Kineococcus indalonis]
MGWNGADLFVQGGLDALPGGFAAGSATSTRFEGFPVAAAVRGGVLHVHFRGDALGEVPEALAARSGAARAVAACYAGVADTYVLEVAEAGVPTRLLVVSAGEAVVDEGEPLPVEDGERDDPEEWLFVVVERLTGTAVPALPGLAETWTELRVV